MASRPTIQMLAERAGVSLETVDRVVNDRPHVNEEIRQRVLAAMKAEGTEGFAVCAVNDPAIQSWLRLRIGEGIPCVTFNSDLPESGRLRFIGQDIRQAGRVAAGLLYKCVSGQGPILTTASGWTGFGSGWRC